MMSIIREAAKITRTTCHNAFADHRWNCSSIDVIPRQTPDLTQGSREQAWVHALSSATLTRSVARGCSSGSLKNCACGSFPRHPPDGQFKWGGCGDNIQFAKKFAKCFSDVHYKKLVKKGEKITNYYATNEWKLPHVIAATNIHNNRAGRKAVEQSLHIQCKCHGVSGSCSVKTCWRSLPAIDEIANRLKRLYSTAVEVVPKRPNVRGKLRLTAVAFNGFGRVGFHNQDLIYTTKSPDYCTANLDYGSFGTQGRRCNVSSNTHGGCTSMCCGRGYVSTQQQIVERCHCKYYWCCYVRCKSCHRVYNHSTCL